MCMAEWLFKNSEIKVVHFIGRLCYTGKYDRKFETGRSTRTGCVADGSKTLLQIRKIDGKELLRVRNFDGKHCCKSGTFMAKKSFTAFLILVILLSASACGMQKEQKEYRVQIITSIFPYYDMVKNLTKGVPSISVKPAVSPGLDSHTFEPAPRDLEQIAQADLFVFNGGSMERWVDEALEATGRSRQNVCMMDSVSQKQLLEADEREEIYGEIHEEQERKPERGAQEQSANRSETEYDEHLWTSPVLMMEMTDIVAGALCKIDPENQAQYQNNAKDYQKQLKQLDSDFRKTVAAGRKKEFIFADKFPLLYFAKEYGLSYYAAFPGCSSDMEPSAKTVAFLEDKIKDEQVGAVFYLELGSRKVADTIQDDTGVEVLQFQSCHNVTQKQFEQGVTYVELMRRNVENLKKALQ